MARREDILQAKGFEVATAPTDTPGVLGIDVSGNLTLGDGITGTVTLADIAGGGVARNVWISAATQTEGDKTLSDATNWGTQYSWIRSVKIVTTATDWSAWLFETSAFNLSLITTRQIAGNRSGDADLTINRSYNSDGTNVYLRFTDNAGTATFDVLITGEERTH